MLKANTLDFACYVHCPLLGTGWQKAIIQQQHAELRSLKLSYIQNTTEYRRVSNVVTHALWL
jgi:hypothetical protein